MFTRNFYKLLMAGTKGANPNNDDYAYQFYNTQGNKPVTFVNKDGVQKTEGDLGTNSSPFAEMRTVLSRCVPLLGEIIPSRNYDVSSKNILSVRFGAGTTPPTYDDFNVEQPLDMVRFDAERSMTLNSVNDEIIETIVLRNTGSEAVTVREYGVFIQWGQQYWTSQTGTMMIQRCLLKNPLTIQPGKTGTLIIKHNYNPDLL